MADSAVTKSSDIPIVRFAPLNVPFKRRRQTFVVAFWLVSLPITLACFFVICTISFFLPWIIAYLLFVLFDIAPENGGRKFEFARRAAFWKWYSEYFPIKFIRVCQKLIYNSNFR